MTRHPLGCIFSAMERTGSAHVVSAYGLEMAYMGKE